MTINLVRFALDQHRLINFVRERGLPTLCDKGYLVHCVIQELWGKAAPKPFSIQTNGRPQRYLPVLGYCSKGAVELREDASRFSDPLPHSCVDWGTLASKEIPDMPPGTRLGYEVRVVPTERSAIKDDEGKRIRAVETEVYRKREWEAAPGDTLDREELYKEWLKTRMEREGSVTMVSAALRGFRSEKVLRRNHRKNRRSWTNVPEATLKGILEVQDTASFAALLARGVGQHRTFGFGMLCLIRPEA